MTAREWAQELSITSAGLHKRLREWPIEQALSTGKSEPRRTCRDHAVVIREFNALSHNGQTQTVEEWAGSLGLTAPALRYRIKTWGIEKALTTPRVGRGRDKRTRAKACALWRDLER